MVPLVVVGAIFILAVGIVVGVVASGSVSTGNQPAPTPTAPAVAEKPAPIAAPKLSDEEVLRQNEIAKWTTEVARLNAALAKVESELKDAEKESELRFMVKRRFGDDGVRGIYECVNWKAYKTCSVIADPEMMKADIQNLNTVTLTVKSLGERRTTMTMRNAFREWEEEVYVEWFEQVRPHDVNELKTRQMQLKDELKKAQFNLEHPERAFLFNRWDEIEIACRELMNKIDAAEANLDSSVPTIHSKNELLDFWRKYHASLQAFSNATSSLGLFLDGTIRRIDEFIQTAKDNADMVTEATATKTRLQAKRMIIQLTAAGEIESLACGYFDSISALPESMKRAGELAQCFQKFAAILKNSNGSISAPFNKAFQTWLSWNIGTLITQKLSDYKQQIDSLTVPDDKVGNITSRTQILNFVTEMETVEIIRHKALAELKPRVSELQTTIHEMASAAPDLPEILVAIKTEEKNAGDLLTRITDYMQSTEPNVLAGHRAFLNSLPEKIESVTGLIEATHTIQKSKEAMPEIWKLSVFEIAYNSWLCSCVDIFVNSDSTHRPMSTADLKALAEFFNSPESDALRTGYQRERIDNTMRIIAERIKAEDEKERTLRGLLAQAFGAVERLKKVIAVMPPGFDHVIQEEANKALLEWKATSGLLTRGIEQKLVVLDWEGRKRVIDELNDGLGKLRENQIKGFTDEFDQLARQAVEQLNMPPLIDQVKEAERLNTELKKLGHQGVPLPVEELTQISSSRDRLKDLVPNLRVELVEAKNSFHVRFVDMNMNGGKPSTEKLTAADFESEYQRGLMYANGVGVEKDDVKAFEWIEKAANHGHPDAQWTLGVLYVKGRGRAKDPSKASVWFQRSADQGNHHGEYNLAVLYREGLGVKKNDTKAFELFLKSAEHGSAEGQNNVGGMYVEGRGVPSNQDEGIKWVRKAAAQGYAPAVEAIRKYDGK